MNHNYLKGCLTKHEEQIDLNKSESSEYTFKIWIILNPKERRVYFLAILQSWKFGEIFAYERKIGQINNTKKFQKFPNFLFFLKKKTLRYRLYTQE
jgi:hypothetical protein